MTEAPSGDDRARDRANGAASVFARWLPLAVALLGVLLTALSIRWEQRRVALVDRQEFFVLTERLRGELSRRVEVYRYGLMGTHSAFVANPDMQPAQFRALVHARELTREFPGALGIGYIERVARSELPAFVARMRASQTPDFTVHPEGDADDLFVIVYIEPIAPNEAARGFDIGQEPRRRAAAEKAMLTGHPCVTEVIKLVQANESGPGFLYLLPRYRPGAPIDTPEARRKALLGWVYMPLLARTLFAGAAKITEGYLDFQVYSGPHKKELLVYDDGRAARSGPAAGAAFARQQLATSVAMDIGGQRWTATMSTTPKFRSARSFVGALALGGLTSSILLGLLLHAQAAAGRRARALARAMTTEVRQLATIVERSTNLVLTTDVDQRITWVNEGFTRVTGYTLAEVVGARPGPLLQFGKSSPEVRARIRQAIDARVPFRGEILNRGKQGNEYWIDLSVQPLFDEREQLTGFMAIASDITDKKRVEEQVAKSAALLAASNAALEEAQVVGRVGSWSFDPATRQLEFSKQLLALLGLGRVPRYDEALALFDAADATVLDAALKRAAASGEGFTYTARTVAGKTSGRYLRCDGRVRTDPSGARELYGTVIDVTDEREREEALKSARKNAEAANRGKSEFLANMSHEIRTPMAAILGYADLLADELAAREVSPMTRECIETIKRNGEHLLSIINDILDVSKIEAGKMTVERAPTHLGELLAGVMSTMSVNAKAKGIALECLIEVPVPEIIRSDSLRLRQILLNVIGNAIKFTAVGSVVVTIGRAPNDPQLVRIEVRDTGIGISEEQGASLFEAFAQADSSTTRNFGGSGLGLRISRRFAQLLGGDISFTSELGKGSVFVITLETGEEPGARMLMPGRPLERMDVPAFAAPPVAPDALKGVRILLAEDGADNQILIAFLLRQAGADVTLANNGRRALEALTVDGKIDGVLSDPCPFDVVLSDIQMPELDGYSLAARLRSLGFRGALIALTAHAMVGDRERCLVAGFRDHLAKPIDRAKLIPTILKNVAQARVVREDARVPALQPAVYSDYREQPAMAALVKRFVDGLPPRLAAVEAAFESGDFEGLALLAHGLAGAAGSYGFMTVTVAARELEHAAKGSDDLARLREKVQHFLAVGRAVRHEPPRASAPN